MNEIYSAALDQYEIIEEQRKITSKHQPSGGISSKKIEDPISVRKTKHIMSNESSKSNKPVLTTPQIKVEIFEDNGPGSPVKKNSS